MPQISCFNSLVLKILNMSEPCVTVSNPFLYREPKKKKWLWACHPPAYTHPYLPKCCKLWCYTVNQIPSQINNVSPATNLAVYCKAVYANTEGTAKAAACNRSNPAGIFTTLNYCGTARSMLYNYKLVICHMPTYHQ